MLLMFAGYGNGPAIGAVHETHAAWGLSPGPDLRDGGGMKEPTPLDVRLSACRNLPGAWTRTYDTLIERLRGSGAMAGAPGVGAVVADFALPDANGVLRRLSDLVAGGPVVLSFNRGSWCPYCHEEISAWAESRAVLAAAGGQLVIITPETGGRMAALAGIAGPEAVVLGDQNMGVALRYGLAFPLGREILDEYAADGFDLAEINGNASGFLPTPATFLIDRDRVVRFAFVDPDFSHRAEPQAVLAALQALVRA